jgi:hypothetical protein
MNRQLLELGLYGWLCLAWGGCSTVPLASAASQANRALGQAASSGGQDQGPNSTATMGSTATARVSASVIEPHIAMLVERTLDRLSKARLGGKAETGGLSSGQRGRARASDQSVTSRRANQGPERQRVKSDRVETLRVTGTSGELCAAVSIASQLAVTALHCARTLCDAPTTPTANSLLGCEINYESPNGTDGHATVVATSENDLLALLDLHRPQPKYGALCCDDPRADDRVYTVSHPGGENWLLSFGWLTRDPIALEWVEGQATRVLVAEIPTKPGSSGGGLFDVQDRLVGIQIARWSPWTTDFGKAAFIQSSRIFDMAGRYCMQRGSNACLGLRCTSWHYDIWNFNVK